MRIPSCLILSVCLLSSCMVGPDFQSPQPELPDSWASARPPKSDMKSLESWWSVFGDPQLDKLIAKAVADNPDMRIEILRIQEARSAAKIQGASLLPSADLTAGATKGTEHGWGSSASTNYSLRPSVSWELDLFGGNRRAVEAAMAALLSTEANALAVRTSLLAEVATNYFSWISASEELRVAREQLALQKKNLDIVKRRQATGFDSNLDLVQAQSQIASTERQIPALEATKKSAENSLSVLLGSYMKDVHLSMPSLAVANKTPTVPVGVPSDLLRRRPDMIAAEADWHQAVANVGVAVADLYPRFSLTGSISSGASSFDEVFRSHSFNWSLGGNISQTLFQGGALLEQVKSNKAAAERAGETYRKTLLTAVSEVEDALIDYASNREQLRFYMAQNEADRRAVELSMELYVNGQTDFLNVLTAQSSLLSSELAIVRTRQAIRSAVANLALAMGGGW